MFLLYRGASRGDNPALHARALKEVIAARDAFELRTWRTPFVKVLLDGPRAGVTLGVRLRSFVSTRPGEAFCWRWMTHWQPSLAY